VGAAQLGECGTDDKLFDVEVHRLAVFGDIAQIQFADGARPFGPGRFALW
jgi:hypothetical protein